MTQLPKTFTDLSSYLSTLLNRNPEEAVKQARKIDLEKPDRFNLMSLRAAILVDGGGLTNHQDAIEEGLALFRELHCLFPQQASISYNLANGLVATIGNPPRDRSWLDHQERTFEKRSEARQYYWKVAQDFGCDPALRTQAWTNLANQFSNSYRLSEAQDAWLAALKIDPENGVAASSAARNLMWIFEQGCSSNLTRDEAMMLAKIALRHQDRVMQYAGAQAAKQIAAFANELGDSAPRSPHTDPFIAWVERERLTLAPAVELVDPALGKLDWLMLSGISERESGASGMPPPVFAMFNILKSDFILARDMVWRVINDNPWPTTGRFADTLDYATYGPDASALILAHRSALALLDKVAVTANHYFELGQQPDKVNFGKLWRQKPDKVTGICPLAKTVDTTIRNGVSALYGLVELADDYDNKDGILRPQKDLRNAGTHRFVILHDLENPTCSRDVPEVEHHYRELFTHEVLHALRVARSSIQMLALAITQHEQGLAAQKSGMVGTLTVPDHDWVRGRKE